ncbi:glycosyl hydrolase family 92 [Sphingomonas sp. UV9]|uniref:glycoside hydrolase domain-containing protein n=1 Tax=Sphingomonas sp. UV9 TaxID=1851410 RepID=UPI000FFBBADD|nr:glycoside hydrolase domain-containing protein [Sphingomonas sp. UV9]RXD07057.1 glycosyl hydrolase family 92 [Sphingomonas sp. UV9]
MPTFPIGPRPSPGWLGCPLSLALLLTPAALTAQETPADLVDPFVGTLADFGQLSPAAVAPFGMMQLGPDTSPANHAGYDHAATTLLGFSHTRGVGVGCGGAGGDLMISLRYAGSTGTARIDKADEQARAGTYRVRYDGGILAEMAATRGAGVLRFTLPRAGPVDLRIDPRHSYSKRLSASWASLASDDLRTDLVAGTVCDQGAYHLHSASRILVNGRPIHQTLTAGANDLATLRLTGKAGDTIEIRTGLSTVDGRGAASVRDTEVGSKSLAAVATETRAAWNRNLGRVVPSGSQEQRALFYTSLYRVMETPVAIDDPDGRHRDKTGAIETSPKRRTRYANWSLWDNYRTQMPLLALLQPERSADIAQSLVALYTGGKPQWSTPNEPFLTVRTEHAGIALLDMHRKGIAFDANAALAGMAADSDTLKRGTPDEQIEAAYDDWATAELARDLGRPDLAQTFTAKAQSYRPMWRSVFQTPGADGDVVKARGLYQGTLWQYRWAPIFDLPWMTQTVGRDRLLGELHHFFDAGLFNMTNEPDIQVPWMFAALGQPQPTADLVRTILTKPIAHPYTNSGKLPVPFVGRSFAVSPQGFADGMDDDAGGMTAWYVFAALGLYPLVPGEPWYVVTTPAFARSDIDLGKGRKLTIQRSGPENGRITQASLNGRTLPNFRVQHADLLRGGTLTVTTVAKTVRNVPQLQDTGAKTLKNGASRRR